MIALQTVDSHYFRYGIMFVFMILFYKLYGILDLHIYIMNQIISKHIFSKYRTNFDFALHVNQAYNNLTVYFLK